jgi:hypothetical protein
LYCLTKKQIYLIGQAIIPQLQWNTRWVGDTSGLDIDEIVANVEVAITMPKCDDISEMLWTINQLAISLQNLQNTVENDGVPVPNETIETPFYQYQGIADNVAGITLACGTTDDKDKISQTFCNMSVQQVAQSPKN